MKLIKARFDNFRLLRNLEIDFSTDSTKKLTVIRAENETGKTTILNGLQWALYGDKALPGDGVNYRISPNEWDVSNGKEVPISAEVVFETTNSTRERKYSIVRSAVETLAGEKFERGGSTVKLYELTEKGSDEIKPPEPTINRELPPELREVFFTDGDKALGFIEVGGKNQVQKAIYSLLALDVIDDARKHVAKALTQLKSEMKKIDDDNELSQVAAQVEENQKRSAELEKKMANAQQQFHAFSDKYKVIQQQINSLLINGNREELQKQLAETKERLKEIEKQQIATSSAHSDLFKSLPLAGSLLAPLLKKGLSKLDELNNQGKILQVAVPVLEELLEKSTCICGETLDDADTDAKCRRERIRYLINESLDADTLQNSLKDLYFGSARLQPNVLAESPDWVTAYSEISDKREELQRVSEKENGELKALEIQLKNIPDADLQGLISTRDTYVEQRDRFSRDRGLYEGQLEAAKKEQKKLEDQLGKLLAKKEENALLCARFEGVRDVKQVFDNFHGRVIDEEVEKVSDLMNKIFLEMIVADPEQGATIQEATIREFNIHVY